MRIAAFVILFFLSLSLSARHGNMDEYNFTSFTKRDTYSKKVVAKISGEKYLQHPDAGKLPYRHPQNSNLIEHLDKRDANTLYFTDGSGKDSRFYKLQSYTPINYLDENGWWREINPRLKPLSQQDCFISDEQPSTLKIEIPSRLIQLNDGVHSIQPFDGVQLVHRDAGGNEQTLGDGNWTNYTAGDDGIHFVDFYPGVDLVIISKESGAEANFVLKNRLSFTDGLLIMRLNPVFDQSLSWNTNPFAGFDPRYISDAEGKTVFTYESCTAYENDNVSPGYSLSTLIRNNQQFDVIVPVYWLNESTRKYPVVIDPVVTTTSTLPTASILGTKYSAVCWTNSCDYFMTVATIPGAKIDTIKCSFEYSTAGACLVQDGGFSFDLNSACFAPAGSGLPVYTNPIPLTGACSIFDKQINEFIGCYPAASCVAQNMNFTLHFYRCHTDTTSTCNGNCIYASKPWIIEVQGRTMEIQYMTPSTTVCGGTSVDLVVTPDYGVQPYTFNWNGGASVNDTFTVNPTSTTIYSVVVTDACGVTASASDTIRITTNTNPGFTIAPTTACVGENIQLTGNGALPASDYDWTVPGSNAAGGVINDNQTPVVAYSLPGNYNITLSNSSGGCQFDSTISVTISSQLAPDVTISTTASGTLCQGDTLVYHATPVSGGSSPTYDWIVDGTLVQSGSTDSLVVWNLHNGSIVQAVLHSNATCVSVTTDTASLFVALSSALTPTVSISPDTTVCAGSPVTFTATATNGGNFPVYQWSVNGVNIAGASASTFTHTITTTDTLIGVILNSSLNCVTTSVTADSVHVALLQNLTPAVTISNDATANLCSGDSVHFVATATNSGTSPVYTWSVNGSVISGPSSNANFTYAATSTTVVTVQMTSSLNCISNPNASDQDTVTAITAAAPTVTFSPLPFVVCDGEPLGFQAVGLNGGSNPLYHWFVNGVLNNQDSSYFLAGPLHDSDIVSLDYISSIPCATPPSAQASFLVQNFPTPVAEFSYVNPYPSAFLNQLEFTNLAQGASSWMWYFPDGDSTATANPIHQFPGLGTYEVTLAVVNGYGCTDTVTYTVKVEEGLAVYIPNTFTPNGDLMNETFSPIGASLGEFEFTIWNRWGELIFTGNQNKPWPGTIRDTSTPAPVGVYVYKLDAKGVDLDEKKWVGRISLIR